MKYLVKMNDKLLKAFSSFFPKKKFEQSLLISTILLSLLSLVIHYHIHQMDVSREERLKSKTDLIREKTIIEKPLTLPLPIIILSLATK